MTAAIGNGFATLTEQGTVLDAWYINFDLTDSPEGSVGSTEVEPSEIDPQLAELAGVDEVRQVRRVAVRTVIADIDAAPADAYDAYLRLHLISGRKLQPHGCNLDGVFGLLTNVVWTNHGPCAVECAPAGFARCCDRVLH